MAKRISTIAPVEQLRGNLSGRQTLKYNDNDNSAFEAPEGKQYAKNYRKSYIGCLRSKDGLAYFQVKTKNCVDVTAASKMRMAVSGGAFAIVASILRQKATIYTHLQALLAMAKVEGQVAASTTLRQFISEPIMNMLRNKNATVTITVTPTSGTAVTVTIKNPWDTMDAEQTAGAEISDKLIQKFWMQLAAGAVAYKVAGAREKLLAVEGVQFADVVNSNINTLKLRDASNGYVFSDAHQMWLNVTKSDAVDTPFTINVNDDVDLIAGAEYYLSDTKIEPEP